MREKKTKTERYTINDLGVCDIEDYIGSDSSLCTVYYSAPSVQYDYGYDYVAVKADGYVRGYDIGIDRFYESGGEWAKEYMLYEYAIFVGRDKRGVNNALFDGLLSRARARGCRRILCERDGGNGEFYAFLVKNGFVEREGRYELRLSDVVLPERDAVLLLTSGDIVTFEQAYFLREQGFTVDRRSLRFEWEGESIEIDRASGLCRFSDIFTVVGDSPFVLDGQRTLSQIDICCQLLRVGVKDEIKVYLPEAKREVYSPDVLVEKWGLFVSDEEMSMAEKRSFFAELRSKTPLEKVTLYQFRFDYEVGGRRLSVQYYELYRKQP